jgi:hypothetical protein
MKRPSAATTWLPGLVLASATVILAGCSPPPPSLAEVSGLVVCDGVPLAGACVVLTPDRDRGTRGPISWGRAGPDGRFTLLADGQPGAVVGHHRVSVALQPTEPGTGKRPARRYRQPDTSGLTAEIRAGQVNELILRLEAGD